MSMFIHEKEIWNEKDCAKAAARTKFGFPWPHKGLIAPHGSKKIHYGQSKVYGKGCIIGERWYKGETIPLPEIPNTYEFYDIPTWGIHIRRKNTTN